MPELTVTPALLRRVLSDTERTVLAMKGNGEDNAAIDLRLKLPPGATAAMIPKIREKVEQAARRYREEPKPDRTKPVERPVEAAALEAAGVSSEEEDTIHAGAGGDGSPVREPPPSSPAPATNDFDDEPEEPPVADEPAHDPASNGRSIGPQREAANARRELILGKLREGERSVKCLSIELGMDLQKVRADLVTLEGDEQAERSGRYAYDWEGAPPEGARSGKASCVWRLWTGEGAPPESGGNGSRPPAEPEPAPVPEPEAEPAAPASEPATPAGDRREEYVALLFSLAAGYPEASHLFDRIEKLIGV